MTRRVLIDFRKWPDRPHWRFAMSVLGEDEHGLWLWSPPGTLLRRGDEPAIEAKHTFAKLITGDRWWTAIWNSGGRHECYVDIATPPEWDGDRVTMIDLDLDLSRDRTSGEVSVLDEDEFLDHSVVYGYPPRLVDRARAVTAQLALDLRTGVEPFGEVGQGWLAQAVALTEDVAGRHGS